MRLSERSNFFQLCWFAAYFPALTAIASVLSTPLDWSGPWRYVYAGTGMLSFCLLTMLMVGSDQKADRP